MTALSDELIQDPLGVSYASMTVSQRTTSLNAITRPGDVPSRDVRRYLMLVNKWAAIADGVVDASLASAQRQSCRALVDALDNFEDFDLEDAQVLSVVTNALASLAAFGYITDGAGGDVEIILAMGANRRSRAAELKLGEVKEGQVEQVEIV